MKCRKCGNDNKPDSKYCGQCGAKLRRWPDINIGWTDNTNKYNKLIILLLIVLTIVVIALFALVLILANNRSEATEKTINMESVSKKDNDHNDIGNSGTGKDEEAQIDEEELSIDDEQAEETADEDVDERDFTLIGVSWGDDMDTVINRLKSKYGAEISNVSEPKTESENKISSFEAHVENMPGILPEGVSCSLSCTFTNYKFYNIIIHPDVNDFGGDKARAFEECYKVLKLKYGTFGEEDKADTPNEMKYSGDETVGSSFNDGDVCGYFYTWSNDEYDDIMLSYSIDPYNAEVEIRGSSSDKKRRMYSKGIEEEDEDIDIDEIDLSGLPTKKVDLKDFYNKDDLNSIGTGIVNALGVTPVTSEYDSANYSLYDGAISVYQSVNDMPFILIQSGEAPDFAIYGIYVGMDAKTAKAVLLSQGFKEHDITYSKGENYNIEFSDKDGIIDIISYVAYY